MCSLSRSWLHRLITYYTTIYTTIYTYPILIKTTNTIQSSTLFSFWLKCLVITLLRIDNMIDTFPSSEMTSFEGSFHKHLDIPSAAPHTQNWCSERFVKSDVYCCFNAVSEAEHLIGHGCLSYGLLAPRSNLGRYPINDKIYERLRKEDGLPGFCGFV